MLGLGAAHAVAKGSHTGQPTCSTVCRGLAIRMERTAHSPAEQAKGKSASTIPGVRGNGSFQCAVPLRNSQRPAGAGCHRCTRVVERPGVRRSDFCFWRWCRVCSGVWIRLEGTCKRTSV
eukprot:5682516-Prymnesium_polylepis.1